MSTDLTFRNPRALQPNGFWMDAEKRPLSVSWALPFAPAKPVVANDDHTVSAVLSTLADRIVFVILGDDDADRNFGRTFAAHDVEQADWYAYEMAAALDLPLSFYFAPEVRDNA